MFSRLPSEGIPRTLGQTHRGRPAAYLFSEVSCRLSGPVGDLVLRGLLLGDGGSFRSLRPGRPVSRWRRGVFRGRSCQDIFMRFTRSACLYTAGRGFRTLRFDPGIFLHVLSNLKMVPLRDIHINANDVSFAIL